MNILIATPPDSFKLEIVHFQDMMELAFVIWITFIVCKFHEIMAGHCLHGHLIVRLLAQYTFCMVHNYIIKSALAGSV